MKAVIVGAILFCVGLVSAGIYLATREDTGGPRLMPIDASYSKRMEEGYWKKGADKPTVTVVEFADFQCPACRSIFQIMDEAIDATKAYTQLQYKEYPLTQHNKSRLAARGAEAAGRQGKFWEMHQVLFARQDSWASLTTGTFSGELEKYAQDIQLNVEQFKKDMKDTSVLDLIDKNISEGDKIPVKGTPTILINGKNVEKLPTSTAEMIQLIEKAKTDAGA